MAAFKLGKMTFGSLFKKPETVLYPVQTKPAPAGLKGHIEIDEPNCILCGMCDRSCPTSCITVDKPGATWSINRYSCIQCGYCVTVCPKKCLAMQPGYAPAATAVAADVFQVPIKPKEDAKPKPQAKPEPAAASKKPETAPEPAPARDEVLEAKIAIMTPDKAAKVRAALAGK